MGLTNNSVAQSGQKSNGFPKNNRLHRKKQRSERKKHIYPREVYKKQPLSEQLGEAARKMQAWEAGVGCGKTSQFAYGAQGAHRVPDGTPAGRPPRRVPAALPPERAPPGPRIRTRLSPQRPRPVCSKLPFLRAAGALSLSAPLPTPFGFWKKQIYFYA